MMMVSNKLTKKRQKRASEVNKCCLKHYDLLLLDLKKFYDLSPVEIKVS